MNPKRYLFLLLTCLCAAVTLHAADDVRCTNNTARSWWDVQRYVINLSVDTANGHLSGSVNLTAYVAGRAGDSLQIDLQEPLKIKAISTFGFDRDEKPLVFFKKGNAYYLTGNLDALVKNKTIKLRIQYEGIPQIAARAPWDGGIVLDRDAQGTRWMGVACQG
ncbi:MAG: hypothetical protein EOP49_30220, partial [Sphingobacteriales bacterium]